MSREYTYQYKDTALPMREFSKRRQTLMAQMEDDSIAIIPSASLQTRSNDTEYKFRQDSDFFYLTGFLEPDSVLVLLPGRTAGEVIYFCRDKNLERELWDGFREGPEGVCRNFGGDDAFPIDDIDDILPGLMEGRERVYYAMGRRPGFDNNVMAWLNTLRSQARTGSHPPGEFLDLDHLLHDMRLFKSTAEIKQMKTAAAISCAAHQHAMATCQPGMNEAQLEAEYLHQFGVRGGSAAAYNTIVGSGSNACVLHYVENNQTIKDGDLVLVDAGCEYQGYAADITRTFPANGKFSKAQAAIYDLVLESQYAAIKKAVSGNHWDEPHNESVSVITQGLVDLKLLDGEVNELIETEAYKAFYMHRVGHWLGLDVHDVGDYKVHGLWRTLEPGMVMTIEPGIYVSPTNHQVAESWRGIGVRIEDNILLKRKGNEVLTDAAVKTRSDIESLMQGASGAAISGRTVRRAPKSTGRKAKEKTKAKKAASKKITSVRKAAVKKSASKKSVAKRTVVKKKAAVTRPKARKKS